MSVFEMINSLETVVETLLHMFENIFDDICPDLENNIRIMENHGCVTDLSTPPQ